MDHRIDRDSDSMRNFATNIQRIAGELETISLVITQRLNDAYSYMQSNSGKTAIAIALETAGIINEGIPYINTLSEQIRKSASLLEESNSLL